MQKKGTLPIGIREARIEFIKRGSSLHAWASTNRIAYSFVHQALSGKKSGPIARNIVSRVVNHLREQA